MTKKQARKVTIYLINLLEYLDGNGLIIEDDEPIKHFLQNWESAGYKALETIIKDG